MYDVWIYQLSILRWVSQLRAARGGYWWHVEKALNLILIVRVSVQQLSAEWQLISPEKSGDSTPVRVVGFNLTVNVNLVLNPTKTLLINMVQPRRTAATDTLFRSGGQRVGVDVATEPPGSQLERFGDSLLGFCGSPGGTVSVFSDVIFVDIDNHNTS